MCCRKLVLEASCTHVFSEIDYSISFLCLNSPVMLRKFDSGVMVIQSKTHSDEEVIFYEMFHYGYNFFFFLSYFPCAISYSFYVLRCAEFYVFYNIWYFGHLMGS